MQSLKDQVVVITGGASGYGKATAKRFREEGAVVIITDIDERVLTEVAGELAGVEAYRTMSPTLATGRSCLKR
jgi:NAD(P)-dependent dehydrogenase (short-subunit alcohol dehydrogenase family)